MFDLGVNCPFCTEDYTEKKWDSVQRIRLQKASCISFHVTLQLNKSLKLPQIPPFIDLKN